jgi:hypothetical protein
MLREDLELHRPASTVFLGSSNIGKSVSPFILVTIALPFLGWLDVHTGLRMMTAYFQNLMVHLRKNKTFQGSDKI